MSVGNNRASIFGVKSESVSGELEKLSLATDFAPLRPGFAMEYKAEELTNEELQSDIGMSKSNKGKESVEGSHDAYLRHSGSEGVAPKLGVLYKSILGNEQIVAVEKVLIGGSTTRVLKVGVGEGVNFWKGQALLIKDAANGYSIRNIKQIVGDDLHLNFDLPAAPAAGVALGKAVSYLAASSGFETFSAWLYQGNGHKISAAAGCTVSELSTEFSVNQFGSTQFKYVGTKYFMNPILIEATNKFLDLTDDGGTIAVSVAEGWYRNPAQLAVALQTALNDASAEAYTVVYNHVSGKFVISSTSLVLSLLWNTGANAANSIGETLGFDTTADDTGAVTYTSDDAQNYEASLTPAYEVSDAIVLKDAEFYIGNPDNLILRSATKATLKIAKKTEDVDGICEETGTREKIATSREVTMEAELILDKHDVSLYDHLLNNDTIGAMLNCGPRVGGNWVPGKCFNVTFPNCTVTAFTPSGDQFVIAKISVRGFIDTNYKDVAVNFI